MNNFKPADLVRNFIRANWVNNTVSVLFEKKDGSIRKMNVKLNAEILKPKSEVPDAGTIKRRETNAQNNNMTVSEILDDGTYQVRIIPCSRVLEYKIA